MFKTLADRIEQSGAESTSALLAPTVMPAPEGAPKQASRPANTKPAQPDPAPCHEANNSSDMSARARPQQRAEDHINLLRDSSGFAQSLIAPQSQAPRPDLGSTADTSCDSADSPLMSVSTLDVRPDAWSPYGNTTGQLVKDGGRNRYVSGRFWESLHTEVRSSTIHVSFVSVVI